MNQDNPSLRDELAKIINQGINVHDGWTVVSLEWTVDELVGVISRVAQDSYAEGKKAGMEHALDIISKVGTEPAIGLRTARAGKWECVATLATAIEEEAKK